MIGITARAAVIRSKKSEPCGIGDLAASESKPSMRRNAPSENTDS
jgi:hypothetical protein